MSAAPFVELVLTCGSWQEAQRIADHLLDNKLVACVEMMDVKSKFRWQGEIQESQEIKLIMQSASHLFSQVESEVAKLHSYQNFVLQQIPLNNVSAQAKTWLNQELQANN